MDFDQLLSAHVGEFGRGQLVVLLAASVGWATLGIAVLSMVFVTQAPTWSCTAADDALCRQQWQLQQQDPAAICKLQPAQYAWDNPGSSLISTFGLVCDASWKVGWANAVFFIGYAVGSSAFGWLADTHGRKAALLASTASMAAVTLLCAGAPSYGWYITGRLLQGVCCSGLPIAAYVLSTESVGPRFRGRAGTGSQLMYHIGEWMLPGMALLLQDWRLLYLAIAACCVGTAALAACVPESPRWQLLHGRQAAAARTLSWLARLNGRQLPQDVVLQLTEGQQTGGDALQPDCKGVCCGSAGASGGSDGGPGAGPTLGPGGLLQQQDSESAVLLQHGHKVPLPQADSDLQDHRQHDQQHIKQELRQQLRRGTSATAAASHAGDSVWMIFTDPLLARLFWVSAWMCSVMATAFFTANLATEKLQGSLYVNFIVTSLGELPATVAGAVAVDAIGRRPTIGTGLLVTGVACYVCSLLQPGGWSTALAMVGKAACSGTWSLAYIYAAELMPTSVRSAALAGSNQAARLGGAVAPFIIYAGERLGHPKMPFALVGVLAAVTALMTALLPETWGKGQPDTMADLHSMYGCGAPRSTSVSSVEAVQQEFESDGSEVFLEERGSGLGRRLLSRASGSWLLAAVRSGSFNQRSAVVQPDGSELQAIITADNKPSASLGG